MSLAGGFDCLPVVTQAGDSASFRYMPTKYNQNESHPQDKEESPSGQRRVILRIKQSQLRISQRFTILCFRTFASHFSFGKCYPFASLPKPRIPLIPARRTPSNAKHPPLPDPFSRYLIWSAPTWPLPTRQPCHFSLRVVSALQATSNAGSQQLGELPTSTSTLFQPAETPTAATILQPIRFLLRLPQLPLQFLQAPRIDECRPRIQDQRWQIYIADGSMVIEKAFPLRFKRQKPWTCQSSARVLSSFLLASAGSCSCSLRLNRLLQDYIMCWTEL